MANYNKVLLMGNLTRDPELRYTPSGAAVCELGLAVNRQWRNQSGESQEETTFVDVTIWGKQGETANQYLSKGRPIFIEGRLQLDTWETQDGQKRSKMRVVAERFQFLGSRGDSGGGQGGGGGGGGGYRQDGGGGGYRQAPPPAQQPPIQPSPAQQPPQDPPQQPKVQEGPRDDEFNLDDVPF